MAADVNRSPGAVILVGRLSISEQISNAMRKATNSSAEGADPEMDVMLESRVRPPASFAPEHSLPHAFSVVANRISQMLERMYGEMFGISVVDWRLIAILGTHSPLSAKALAELTAMDQVSVSRAIDQLTNKKLVLRRIDAADRRRVALSLSKKGLDVYNQVVPLLYASEAMLVARLPAADAASIHRIMEALVDVSGELFGVDNDWRAIIEGQSAGRVD